MSDVMELVDKAIDYALEKRMPVKEIRLPPAIFKKVLQALGDGALNYRGVLIREGTLYPPKDVH